MDKYKSAIQRLKPKERVIIKQLGLKSIVSFIKVYNNLCSACRQKIVFKPKLEYTEYCPECQKMAYEVLRGYLPQK